MRRVYFVGGKMNKLINFDNCRIQKSQISFYYKLDNTVFIRIRDGTLHMTFDTNVQAREKLYELDALLGVDE